MFSSHQSKLHYEKVLGPSKLFSPGQDSDEAETDSEYQQPTDQNMHLMHEHHRMDRHGNLVL